MMWEYKIAEIMHPAGEALNELGKIGWELVTVTDLPNQKGIAAYLKRPIPISRLDSQ